MSRFYASISGSAKTEATRIGSTNSGITGHVRGWTSGIRVDGGAREVGGVITDVDEFFVYATSGSGGGGKDQYIGVLRGNDFTPAEGLDYKKMKGKLDV